MIDLWKSYQTAGRSNIVVTMIYHLFVASRHPMNALFQDSGSSSRPYLSSQTITSSVSLGHGCTAKIKERTDTIRQKKLPSGMNENACCCSCFWNDTFICLSTRAPQRIRLSKDRYTGLFRALLPKGLKIGLKRKRIASKRLPSQIYPLQALFKLAFN